MTKQEAILEAKKRAQAHKGRVNHQFNQDTERRKYWLPLYSDDAMSYYETEATKYISRRGSKYEAWYYSSSSLPRELRDSILEDRCCTCFFTTFKQAHFFLQVIQEQVAPNAYAA